MSKKLYEEENIRAIADKIREHTETDTTYITAEMPNGVDEVYSKGYEDGVAITNDATATAAYILAGYTAYVKGKKITGTATSYSVGYQSGYTDAGRMAVAPLIAQKTAMEYDEVDYNVEGFLGEELFGTFVYEDYTGVTFEEMVGVDDGDTASSAILCLLFANYHPCLNVTVCVKVYSPREDKTWYEKVTLEPVTGELSETTLDFEANEDAWEWEILGVRFDL